MKTKEYRLEVNVCDMMTVSTKISATEYAKKLSSLKRQVAESKYSEDSAFIATEREKTVDFDTYIRIEYRATLGTTDIELIAIICKPGYCFKKGN